jgi:hypothetical protein
MPYTKDKSIRVFARCDRLGLDWNGDHQTRNARTANWLTRTRTGEANPKWREQVKSGQNATTFMTGVFDNLNSSPGSVVQVTQQPGGGGPFYTITLTGELGAYIALNARIPGTWVPISSLVAYNRGLTSYLKKVNQVNVAFSGGVFLGELRETLKMIRNPAQGLRNILGAYANDLKRQKRKSPKNWRKNLGSTWLEYAFGIVPLVSDIQDASKAWNRLVEEPMFVPVRAVGVEERSNPTHTFDELLLSFLGDAYSPGIVHVQRAVDRAVCVFRGYVKRESRATAAGKAQLFGFDPIQFVPTVWELLPWSFLIDYFSNIGDIIEAGCVSRSQIAWTNVSNIVFQELIHVVNAAPSSVQSGYAPTMKLSGSTSTAFYTRRTITRNTPSDIGFPSLTLELPGREAQWANMTALFAQMGSDIHPQRLRR